MSIISDALKSFVSTRQKDNENLQDYSRRFRTSKEIFESHVGCLINLKKYILTMDEYKWLKKKQVTITAKLISTMKNGYVWHLTVYTRFCT